MLDPDRPAVEVRPGMRFGLPQIRGIPTDAIAGMVRAGEPVETTADDYGLSVHEVLLACWYEAEHGQYRKKWRRWARDAYGPLARGEINGIEAPPAKRPT